MTKSTLQMSPSARKYLLWFAQEHLDFRFEEINSLLCMFNIKMDFIERPNKIQPYWLVQFNTENDIKQLASRSVSLRSCIELWSYAETIESIHTQMRQYPYELMAPYMKKSQSFKIEVETFCKHFTQTEKVQKLEAFSYLPVNGQVKLKDPDVIFQYIEYYGVDPKSPPENPYMVFFGRWITNGLRQLIQDLSLKKRKFIGNTSMDPQLSLLMANQAQVQSGSIILDPFVGSGSLLVAAAQFGGYVLGTDIDYLMLHARTRPSRITQKKREKDESVKANMAQYGLDHKYIDVLVNDFAIPFWRDNIRFDAIITDRKSNNMCVISISVPLMILAPYGIREATEKIGTSKEHCTISKEHLPTHIPAKVAYGFSHLYFDLLAFSAKHLKLGGRLVCWFPIFRADYNEDGLPRNTSLILIANSEQILSKYTSRRLLTYEKISEPQNETSDGRNDITDFRRRYYDSREETRKERRMKKAVEQNRNRPDYIKK